MESNHLEEGNTKQWHAETSMTNHGALQNTTSRYVHYLM